MLRSMLQEQFSPNWTRMAIDIPSLLFQKPYLQPRGIMKYTIENYWQFSEHLRNGGTTFKDQRIQQSLLGDTRFPPDLRPLYMFRPIDVDSGPLNLVQTYPLLNKPVATQRLFGLIIILFYFSYDFLIISPLYYLLFPLSPYLGL